MSVDAVVIYAERGHGRRSGVYTDYTFAVWNAEEEAGARELVPFAKAYSGLSDKEIREMDAIVRRTRSKPTVRCEASNPNAGVRARLRGHRAEQTSQKRRRRPLPPDAALAPRQADCGSRHARRAQGALGRAGRAVRGIARALHAVARSAARATWRTRGRQAPRGPWIARSLRSSRLSLGVSLERVVPEDGMRDSGGRPNRRAGRLAVSRWG